MKLSWLIVIGFVVLTLLPLVHAGAPPPPPPPPCPQKLEGCYDQKDIRKGAGVMTPEEFGYYISQTACLTGNCICSLTTSINDPGVRQIDPDESLGACACVLGTSWANLAGAEKCCGNEAADCGILGDESRLGQVIENYLCAMSSDLIGLWVPANPNVGDIAYLGCNDYEYLSNGTSWSQCNEYKTTTIKNHEYICTGQKGKKAWVECCGSGACNSNGGAIGGGVDANATGNETGDDSEDTSGGLRLQSGGSLIVGTTVLYCLSDGTFDINLDNVDKTSCEGADFDWTGKLCCSEADDPTEYYNDIDGKGGCWNKETVFTGDPVPNVPSVANFDGQFFGCNVQQTDLLSLKDYHTGLALINVTPYCFQDERKFYVCKTDGTWMATSGKDLSHMSVVISAVNPTPLAPSSCCATDQCWDGGVCVANQRTKPNSPSVNGYRCIDGNWTNSTLKVSPGEDLGGFCPKDTQCLVSPFGNPQDNDQPDKKPQCIAHGQYIENNYCQDGMWTSRTKFVAQQLLDMTVNKNKFVVFCDSPNNTLNNLQYQIQGQLAETIVKTNAYNFCVFTFDDNKVILGTTLVKKLETDDTILDVLEIPDCNSALNNNVDSYKSCTGTGTSKAWYNSKMQSIIYSTAPFSITTGTGNNLKDIFKMIIAKLSGNTLQPFEYKDLFKNLGRFEKIYISKNSGKTIWGTVEGFGAKRLAIEYTGFTTNICEFITDYNRRFSDSGSRIACDKQGSTYIVVSEGTEFTKINPDKIWNDLTSKLRVS